VFQTHSRLILDELGRVLSEVKDDEFLQFQRALVAGRRIFVTGQGRTGLVLRAFAMRLMQMGIPSFVVGETTTPPITPADLLIAGSGTGRTSTTALRARQAKELGAPVVLLTAHPQTELAGIADTVVTIPAATRLRLQDELPSQQFGGSLFEQALMLFLDTSAQVLVETGAATIQEMTERHANLE